MKNLKQLYIPDNTSQKFTPESALSVPPAKPYHVLLYEARNIANGLHAFQI